MAGQEGGHLAGERGDTGRHRSARHGEQAVLGVLDHHEGRRVPRRPEGGGEVGRLVGRDHRVVVTLDDEEGGFVGPDVGDGAGGDESVGGR